MNRVPVALLPAILLLITACNAGSSKEAMYTLSLRPLHVSGMCAYTEKSPALLRLGSRADLDAAWQSLNRAYVGASPATPEVRFPDEQAMVFYMGQKSTAGYSLALLSNAAELQKGQLTLHLQWKEPEPGSMQAQVITSPCILVALPALVYQGVRVMDQDGRVRFESKSE